MITTAGKVLLSLAAALTIAYSVVFPIVFWQLSKRIDQLEDRYNEREKK